MASIGRLATGVYPLIYQESQPSGELGKHVLKMVYYQDYQAEHSKERFLPDGTTNLVIDLEGTEKYIYDNDNLKVIQRCQGAWFSGMHNQFLTISSGINARMLVVSFKAGGAYPFINQSLYSFKNKVVDGDRLWGIHILQLQQTLKNTSEPNACISLVTDFLTQRLVSTKASYQIILKTVEGLAADPQSVEIGALSSQSGYSQKQFIHLFKTYVGLSPKQFQRVLRFKQILTQVHQQQAINWAEQALSCGYYDQAHFVKDFHAFSGLNPRQYLHSQGQWQHYVPVHEHKK